QQRYANGILQCGHRRPARQSRVFTQGIRYMAPDLDAPQGTVDAHLSSARGIVPGRGVGAHGRLLIPVNVNIPLLTTVCPGSGSLSILAPPMDRHGNVSVAGASHHHHRPLWTVDIDDVL